MEGIVQGVCGTPIIQSVDPNLTLDARGAACALLTFNDRDNSTSELAALIGVNEKELVIRLDELVACGYADHRNGLYIMQEVF